MEGPSKRLAKRAAPRKSRKVAVMTTLTPKVKRRRRTTPINNGGGTGTHQQEPAQSSTASTSTSANPVSQFQAADSGWQQFATTLIAQLQKTAAGNIDKPKFSDAPFENPVRFLEQFDSYVSQIGTTTDKLRLVSTCFAGRVEEWAQIRRGFWLNFDDFKRDFLSYFWSHAKQLQVRNEALRHAYDGARGLSMSDFFIRKFNVLKTLSLSTSECLMINDLMRLFPLNIQSLWMVIPDSEQTLPRALEFLSRQSLVIPPKKPFRKETSNDSKNVVNRAHDHRGSREVRPSVPPQEKHFN